MGKAFLTPRHSLNAFFRSPSQLDVRTSGSQQKLTAHFAFSSIHKLKLPFKSSDKCFSFRLELVDEFPKIVQSAFGPFIGHHQGLLACVRCVCFFRVPLFKYISYPVLSNSAFPYFCYGINLQYWFIGLVGREFTNDPGDLGSIPG